VFDLSDVFTGHYTIRLDRNQMCATVSRRVRTVFTLAQAARSDTRKFYPTKMPSVAALYPARRREKRSIDVVAVQSERVLVN